MSVVSWIRAIFSALLVVAVLLPLVRNDHWVFRTLEYPRFQKFLLCLFATLTWLVPVEPHPVGMIAPGIMALCSLFLFVKIFPYTPFARKEVISTKGRDKSARLRLFSANVYEKNRNYERLLEQIRLCDPDIVFLVETDDAWMAAVKELKERYPYALEMPLSNTYGMLLYSRLKLGSGEFRHLVQNDVPSIHATVILDSGQHVRFWGLHPKPPVPGENIRSTAKDRELLLVADLADKSELPVIVTGDLNDVAWSYTTDLFRKTSRLLDPRRGRGFYSTYNAKNFLMRFPLDYIFCSNDFGLISMKRLSKNGSDHFPMFIELQFDPSFKKVQGKPRATRDDREKAADKINSGASDRLP